MSLLKWALVFFVVSIIAALFGFTDIAAATADVARILFYIFLVIFIVLLVLGIGSFSKILTDPAYRKVVTFCSTAYWGAPL